MKCSRMKCTRTVNRQGLCHSHYDYAPLRGYVDSSPTKARIELLLSLGVGWGGLEAQGVSMQWWRQIGSRVQARVEAKVFAIPVPQRMVPGGCVPAVGSVRKLQALAAMGWPFALLAPRVGHGPQYFSQLLHRDQLLSRTAAMIDSLYRELHMVPGPSQAVRDRSRRLGWVTALAWTDIDDPTDVPDVGERVRVSAIERISELREVGITDRRSVAARLGILPESVLRTLERSAA